MSDNKRVPTVLERLERAEQALQALGQVIDGNNQQHQKAITSIVEVMTAIIKCSGPEFDGKVQSTIIEARKKRAQDESDKAKAALEDMVAKGLLVSAETLSEGSVVVGREFDKEGNLLGTGRSQVEFSQFVPDAKTELLGKGPGFVYNGSDGSFEVLEVYNFAPPASETPSTEAKPEETK